MSDEYPELEPLVALKPDLVFSGWSWGLVEAKNTTPDNLATYGIKTYILSESCDWGPGDPTKTAIGMETVYTDLQNLGRSSTCRRRPKSRHGAEGRDRRGAATRRRRDAEEGVPLRLRRNDTVHRWQSRRAARSDHACRRHEHLRRRGQELGQGSWEAVVAAQPDCIILNEYGGASASSGAAYKENFLKTSPITKDLPAVTNNCILTLDFDELAPGPRNAAAIEAIARWLYPEAFQ